MGLGKSLLLKRADALVTGTRAFHKRHVLKSLDKGVSRINTSDAHFLHEHTILKVVTTLIQSELNQAVVAFAQREFKPNTGH